MRWLRQAFGVIVGGLLVTFAWVTATGNAATFPIFTPCDQNGNCANLASPQASATAVPSAGVAQVKSTPALLIGVQFANGGLTLAWCGVYNSLSSTTTLGTSVLYQVPIASNSVQPIYVPPTLGVAGFTSALTVGCTTLPYGTIAVPQATIIETATFI